MYTKMKTDFEKKNLKSKFKKKDKNFKWKAKGKVRREINKKTKTHLAFDQDARMEFIGGFQKRKQERKAYHKTRLAKQLVEEKLRIRSQARRTVGKLSSSHSILPELEDLLNAPEESTEIYDVGNVTVSITSLEDAIHKNVPELPGSDSEEVDTKLQSQDVDSDVDENMQKKLRSAAPQGKNIKSVMNKETNRILQQSKAYKASQRLKQKNRKFKGKNKRKNDKSTPAEPGTAKTRASHQDHNSKRKGGKKNSGKGKKARK
jgi:ribosomal RNA-processing protein 17